MGEARMVTVPEGLAGERVDAVLARLFVETATDINIYFGMAANEAHEGTGFDFQVKLALIRQLEECLRELRKNVKISFC